MNKSETNAPSAARTDTPSVSRASLEDLVAIVLAVALLSALGELAFYAVRKFVFGSTLHMSPSIVWMTPAAVLLVMTTVALPLVLISRRWRAPSALAVVTAVTVMIGVAGVLFAVRGLGVWAIALLAVGIGVQSGRLLAEHRQRVLPMVRGAALVLGILFVLLGTAVEGGLALWERRVESRLPPHAAQAPNVLLIILDTVRAMSLSLYGYERTTSPNLARWATTGVTFDRAIVPATWTVPSHGSMFTGRWPREMGGWWSTSRPPSPTLASVLRSRGYRTGGFIGNWYHINRESGLSHGFTHFSDLDRSGEQMLRGSALVRWLSSRRSIREVIGLYETLGRKDARQVNRETLRWVGRDSSRPFFAVVNYMDAHSPYLPPEPYMSRFGGRGEHAPIVIEELNLIEAVDSERARAEAAAYDGGLAYLDSQLGRLLDTLEGRGALENTIVIITADHGEELGEHGRWGHAYGLHGEIVHVPLVVFGPGVPAGVRISEPVSVRNVAATVTDLARVPGATFPGISLAARWRGGAPEDTALTEFGSKLSLYDERYHYLQAVRGDGERLYDYRVDPYERRDLATNGGASVELARFRELLATIVPETAPVEPGAPVPAVVRQ
jgi:arylsulfatase A-like enzyme